MFFFSTKSTLIKAIQHDNLLGIPGLTEHAVKKYLPESTATIKGHLHQTRENIRSTRLHAKLLVEQENNINDDLKPHENKMAPCELFCFAAVANEIKGTVYTDLPGRFPARSYKGNQYIFLTYVYDANAIIVRPMKSRTKEDMLKVFQDVYEYLKRKKLHQNYMSWITNAQKR